MVILKMCYYKNACDPVKEAGGCPQSSLLRKDSPSFQNHCSAPSSAVLRMCLLGTMSWVISSRNPGGPDVHSGEDVPFCL